MSVFLGVPMKKTNIIYYEFRFKSRLMEKVEICGNLLANFILPFFFFVIIYSWLSLLNIDIHLSSIVLKCILLGCFICGIVFAGLYSHSLKGVFLLGDSLEIARYASSYWPFFQTKICIPYSDIETCELVEKDFSNYNERYFHFVGGDANPYVKLTTHTEKVYCFSVERQEEFVKELLQKMHEAKKDDCNSAN